MNCKRNDDIKTWGIMEVKYYAYDYNLCSSNILFKSCKIDEDIKTLGVVEVKHQTYMIYDNKIIYDECSTSFQTFILNPRLLVQVQRRSAKLPSHTCFAGVYCIEQAPSLWIFAIGSISSRTFKFTYRGFHVRTTRKQKEFEDSCYKIWSSLLGHSLLEKTLNSEILRNSSSRVG